ncbi:hypothetical protein C1752_01769 [Acaryochloris thomasi RCC1774]|uniref:Uncharacterized protein n=1 Tax=Acaryochloris thomasi RCC1774 TaxID=1764569 RepID=A0A2W1JKJ7_9CYAN|nr:hypothetical protein [Acaryochloris thomasi]PZD73918.1 hypothetical protein C1752_01769 [Acaryochloris thomasi RCC1774]
MAAGKWIAKNLSLGGIIRHTGSAAGTAAKLGLHGLGAIAESSGNRNVEAIGSVLRTTGEVAKIALTETGKGAGFVADRATEYAGKAGGELTALGATAIGADQATIATAKKVGTVVGSAAVGAVAEIGVAEAAVALSAASGTAGAAATSSGLAALGGGSLATGGGGMAAGQAVTQGIVGAGSVAGAVGTLNSKEKPQPLLPGSREETE